MAKTLYLVTVYTRYMYMYAHHVPHVEHVESWQSDEVTKHGRDVVWSLLTAPSCCPPSIFIVLLFIVSPL